MLETITSFYFGGTAANNFNLTAADVTSDGGTFNLVNGSAISFEIGAAATQTIGDVTISDASGNWGTSGTVRLCNNNSGGGVTTGGDLNVGGDTNTQGKLTVGAQGICFSDNTTQTTAAVATSGTAGTIPVFDASADGVGDSVIAQTPGVAESWDIDRSITQVDDDGTPQATQFNFLGPSVAGTFSQAYLDSLSRAVLRPTTDERTAIWNAWGLTADTPAFTPATVDPPVRIRVDVDASNFIVFTASSVDTDGDYARFTGLTFIEGMGGLTGPFPQATTDGRFRLGFTAATNSTATVTGDLEATGTYTGSINNINPDAGAFQIWAGTQTQFDAQYGTFDADGNPEPGGGFIDNAGTAASVGPEDRTGTTIYIIR